MVQVNGIRAGRAAIEQCPRGKREVLHQVALTDGFSLRSELGDAHQLRGPFFVGLEEERMHGNDIRLLFAYKDNAEMGVGQGGAGDVLD